MHSRDFIRSLGATTIAALIGPRLWAQYEAMPAPALAEDEGFWTALRAKYRLKPDYINLEHGYYSMQSEEVLEKFIAGVREVNYHASYYMRTMQTSNNHAAREKLAALAGCPVEELIITRNTTVYRSSGRSFRVYSPEHRHYTRRARAVLGSHCERGDGLLQAHVAA